MHSRAIIPFVQRIVNLQATQQSYNVSLTNAQNEQDIVTMARLNAIAANGAADWKRTMPSSKQLHLCDIHYQVAAKINLGVEVLPVPRRCFGCKKSDACAIDPLHYLSCNYHKRREITMRHNAVVEVLHKNTLYAGGIAAMEPPNLSDEDGRRPDIQMILNGQHILSDVRISHPCCPTHAPDAARHSLATAKKAEAGKIRKYRHTANIQAAQFIPFAVETFGGLGPQAEKLIKQIIITSRDQMILWPHLQLVEELRGAIAIAIQRGNAMTMLAGYAKCAQMA